MPLSVGDRLGPYEILAPIGAGGMGEVYRAHDPRVGRNVAIKVSKERFTERFEREARAIAAMNHPNICQLYDVGPDYLVMELIEGEAPKGPLPVEEALVIARQIAEALEAAHEKGIVHRDLKPGNIRVKGPASGHPGTVKVLDFGLAKVATAASSSGENSPTLTMSPTIVGVILGTAAYMAPEQARGGVVDKRADIWAFGVVLWELLTGRRLFTGETVSDTLAAVLKTEVDLSPIPMRVRPIVERCLRRDAGQRWHDIADVRIEIEEALVGAKAPWPAEARPAWIAWGIAAGLAVVAAGCAWIAWRATRAVDYPLTRLSVDLGAEAMTGNVTAAISPDGRRLVFPARGPNGKQALATRLLDQSQANLLPETENGRDPFFSPDSQWLGFFADGNLMKLSFQGGAPVSVCEVTFDSGASWGEDDTIVAGLRQNSGISRVPAAGGRPRPLTRLSNSEGSHGWPQLLPGGHAILFTASAHGSVTEDASIEAMSLSSGVTKSLVPEAYFGRVLPAGGGRSYLVYLHQGVLFGVAFDSGRLEVQSAPVPLLEDVAASPIGRAGEFDFSAAPSGHGTLIYLAGKRAGQTWPVMWLDSSGRMQPLIWTPGVYATPRFSPDGQRLALTVSTGSGTDIYSYDWQREIMTRVTFGGGADLPVWAPDGKHMAFNRSGRDHGIWWTRSDGSGRPQQILAGQDPVVPWPFSPDGQHLAYREFHSETGTDIWTLPLDTSDPDHPKPGKPEPFLVTPADELVPMFSPDGRWIAYRSNESGRSEIYVRPFPSGRAGKWQISTGGGLYGIWSNKDRELFYETTDHRIAVVDYTVNGDSFVPGKARVWSEKQVFYTGNLNLDLAPDGKRFAVFPMPEAAEGEKGSVHVVFLQNFLDELRRRIPGTK